MFQWNRRRDLEMAAIKKQLARIEGALASVNQTPSFDIAAVMGNLVDGQMKQIDATGGFIRMISDIATERMAAALGKRGGKARTKGAARDARGRLLPTRRAVLDGDCRMCNDPMLTDFSVEEFAEHQKHRGRGRSIPTQSRRVEDDVDERDTVVERPPIDLSTYPLPVVQRPGENDSGSGSDSTSSDGTGGNHSSHEGHIH